MKYKHLNKIILVLLLFINISIIFAQSELDSLNLEEVIISANKEAQNKSQVAQQFTILTKKNIEKINAASSADLISSQDRSRSNREKVPPEARSANNSVFMAT